jgi:hypothetical protein
MLDFDLLYGITGFWHAEVFDCTSGTSLYWTKGFSTRNGAIAAAEAFIEAHEAQEGTDDTAHP